MAVKTERESKVVHNNASATVVIINGATKTVKVTRPKGDGEVAERYILFDGIQDLAQFIEGVVEVFNAAAESMGASGFTLQRGKSRK